MRADAIQGTQLVDSHLNRKNRKCTRPSSSQTTSTQKNLTLFPKSSEPLGVEAASTDRDPTTQSVGGADHCGGSSREYRTGGGASSGSTITKSNTERRAEGRETNMISPRDPLRGARKRRVDGRVDGTGGGGVQVGAEESELQEVHHEDSGDKSLKHSLRHHNPTAWLLVLFLGRMIIRGGEWRHFFSGRMGVGGGSDIENARLDG